jgi:hypothetical protein
MSREQDHAAQPAMPASRTDEGGDPACWANLVCPECGLLNPARHRSQCERCGAVIPVLD